MEEIMARAECYIKGEESNTEKKATDYKERKTNSDRKNYYPSANRDRGTFKRPYGREREYMPQEEFTPLNIRPKKIFIEGNHTKLIPDPSFLKCASSSH